MGKRRWTKQAPENEEERKKKNATKYHFLLFVEKQKVQRKLLKIRAKLAEQIQAGKATEATRKELAQWEADLQYVEHYPLEQKYCALFPKVDSEESKKRREEIRELIRKRLIEKANKGEDEDEKPDDDFFASGDASDDEDDAPQPEPAQPLSKGKGKGKGKGEGKGKGKGKGAKGEGKGSKGAKGAKGKGKGASEEVKRPREEAEADPNVHPSWAAKKSAAQTGSLADTKFEGKKVTFDSDDEGEVAAPPKKKTKKEAAKKQADTPVAKKVEKKPREGSREETPAKEVLAKKSETVDESLHPSWVASQKKKAEAAATFSGKRMTFDDSDDE